MTTKPRPFHDRQRGMPWKYKFKVVRTETYNLTIFDNEVRDWPIPAEEVLEHLKNFNPSTKITVEYNGPNLLSSDVDDWNRKKEVE